MTIPSFDEYVESLSAVDTAFAGAEPHALQLCVRATASLSAVRPVDRAKLASIIEDDPHLVPVFVAAAGVSQERFKTWLTTRFSTAGWVQLGRRRASDLVGAMDDDMGIVALLEFQAGKRWSWADVLARTMAPQQRAGSSVVQGRALENAVETVVQGLGLPFVARTRFAGTGGRSGPADFAIPAAGDRALIAIGVKGYDSTGSKLADAATEIEAMAEVRKPTQFIFAVVDGYGWLRRKNDLRRIHSLWDSSRIDGVYNLATLPALRRALEGARRRLSL